MIAGSFLAAELKTKAVLNSTAFGKINNSLLKALVISRDIICISLEKHNKCKRSVFIFPDYESFWQFKNQTQAVNLAVTPKKTRSAAYLNRAKLSWR